MLHARVREHALEVALAGHEHRRDPHGEKPQGDEQLPRKPPLAGGLHDAVDPEESEKRAARHSARQEGADDPRRLAVGIGFPRMERSEPHLRPVADEQEHEPGAQPRPGELVRMLRQGSEDQAVIALRPVERRVADEERAQEGDGDSDRADHQVLPGRLERPRVVIEVDENGGRKRRAFDGDPHDRQVLGERDRRRHREKRQEAGAEHAIRPLGANPQVADPVDGAQREEGRHDQQNQVSEGIDSKPAVEGGLAVRQHQRARQMHDSRRGHDPGTNPLRRRQEREEGRADGKQDESEHRFSPSIPRAARYPGTRTRAECG